MRVWKRLGEHGSVKIAKSFLEGKSIAAGVWFPLVIRPSFTWWKWWFSSLQKEDYDHLLNRGLQTSPIHEVLIDKAVLGWKEYELELLRDKMIT